MRFPARFLAVFVSIAFLLAANACLLLTHRSPVADGLQDTAGRTDQHLATAVTQSGQILVFVFDETEKALTQYEAKSDGLHLRGIRKLGCDFKILEFPQPTGAKVKTSVVAIRKEAGGGYP